MKKRRRVEKKTTPTTSLATGSELEDEVQGEGFVSINRKVSEVIYFQSYKKKKSGGEGEEERDKTNHEVPKSCGKLGNQGEGGKKGNCTNGGPRRLVCLEQ